MWSPGQPSQGSMFPLSPPKTEGLPAPVNVDNVGEVIISSSSLSKLPLKRPYHYLHESEPLDYNTQYFLDLKEFDDPIPEPDPRLAAAAPVQEAGLLESNTREGKKTSSQINREYRERKKLKNQELENNFEKSKMANAKLEVLLKESEAKAAKRGEKNHRLKAQNAQLLATIESSRLDVAKMEENIAQFKIYEGKREQAIPRLHQLIMEDDSFKISKEDLWAQFCSPINGMQTFENYWEESMKYKNELRAIVETLLLPK